MKITTKLSFSFLYLSLLPLLLTIIIINFFMANILRQQLFNHIVSIASIVHEKIENSIDNDFDDLSSILVRRYLSRNLKGFIDSTKKDYQIRINQFLISVITSNKNLKNASIMTSDGTIVASTDSQRIGINNYDAEIFLKGMKGSFVNFLLDENGELILQLSGPIVQGNTLLGVLILETNPRDFGFLDKDYYGLGRTGEIILTKQDTTGDVSFLTSINLKKKIDHAKTILQNKLKIPFVQSILKYEALLTESKDEQGKIVLATGYHIENAGWGFVVKIDKEEVFAPIGRLRELLLIILLFSSLIVVLISLYLARSITTPVLKLTKVVEKIKDGNLSLKTEIRSKDEIGILSQAFDLMTHNLADSKVIREQKVKETTIANEQLQLEIEERKKLEIEREKLIRELQDALANIKILRGFLPICAWCKKIRDDKGYWNQIEVYIGDHSMAEFTHSICPECAKKFSDEINNKTA